MKAETKAMLARKWNKAKTELKEAMPWILFWGGVGYTTTGLVKAHHDHKEVNRLRHGMEEMCDCINQHAAAGNNLVDRVNVLERQNNELLERALKETEGKAD